MKERAARQAVFPDLRNQGVLARALMLYVLFCASYALAVAPEPAALLERFVLAIGHSAPQALVIALVWVLGAPWLRRLAYWQAASLLALLGLATALMATRLIDIGAWRSVPLTLAALFVMLAYFHTLGEARSPAVTEARLQALQARIRPHFLFNTLNAVLAVIRSDPPRAEAALEDLAALFRALMKEYQTLAPLEEEITLTRQYLDLEKLRLGDRLQVDWKLERMPRDALVPPLILQPIAENAVYHGIEAYAAPGTIEIEACRVRDRVVLAVRNPFVERPGSHHGGNKMAIQNIRDRLALHFDAEAQLVSGPRGGRYEVRITLPYRRRDDRRSAV
ncbi:MAG: histidine kinase [Casimicrobiaceae bacterium]|nr:histidine kinase [Casimicrobiaceae bacterium]